MTIAVAKNHINQFNQTQKLLHRYLKDDRLSRPEIRYLRARNLSESTQALVEDVICSQRPKTTFRANFRGALPAGYDAGDFFLKGDRLHRQTGISDRITLKDLQSGESQGVGGTCSILAAAIGNAEFVNNGSTATFKFYDRASLQPVYTTVKTQTNLRLSKGVLGWLEMAYSLFLQKKSYVAAGKTAWQEATDGNDMATVIQDLKGVPAANTAAVPTYSWMETMLASGKTLMISNAPYESDALNPYFYNNHAYRVLAASGGSVSLQNPWGYDGKAQGDPRDGMITVCYETFKASLPYGNCAYG